MSEWKKTGCVLCAQNCGLEVYVENNRITNVKPDRDNPRSEGYVCRKGLNVMYHQYPGDRLTEPLKRVGDGFEPITWGEAIGEIADKMKSLVGEHGPRCLSYMGGGAQGGHFEVAFALSLLRAAPSTITRPPGRNSAVRGGCPAGCWESSTMWPYPMSTPPRCWWGGA